MGILCCCACCFQMLSSRALEINLIVMSSILFFLLFLCFIIIKWKNFSAGNVVFFVFMFLISLANIVISSFLRYWRAKNLIKTSKKSNGVKLAIAGFTLTIIYFIICFIEEIIFSYNYIKTNYPCLNNNNGDTYGNSYTAPYYYKKYMNTTRFNNPYIRILDDDKIDICQNRPSNYDIDIIKGKELFMAYFTFSFSEIYLIFGMFIWWLLKGRIKQGLDGPLPEGSIGRQVAGGAMYDQYGRQVVVVQPGDVVVMDGQRNVAVPMDQYNQYYNPNSNQYNNQINNQYNIPNSNQYNNQINNQYNNQIHNDVNNEEDSQNISAQVHPEKPDSQEYKLD